MNRNVLALSTALSILAFTPAFAQNATVDCTQEVNRNDPACMNPQHNNTRAQTSTTSTTTPMGGGALIVPAERLDGVQLMAASDYIGKTVYDQAANDIGDVNDLIVSGDGNVEAVILGVGGFLGIGEKDVAVNTEAIRIIQDGDSKRLVVQATKEALESAPTFDRNNRRYASRMTGTATDQTGSVTQPAPATNSNATGNTGTAGAVDCALPDNASAAACVNQQQNQQ